MAAKAVPACLCVFIAQSTRRVLAGMLDLSALFLSNLAFKSVIRDVISAKYFSSSFWSSLSSITKLDWIPELEAASAGVEGSPIGRAVGGMKEDEEAELMDDIFFAFGLVKIDLAPILPDLRYVF